MSWYAAIHYLRRSAEAYRGGDKVSEAQMDAVKEALKIFDTRVLGALKSQWLAEALEDAAVGLERLARNAETVVIKRKTPKP